VNCEFVAKGDEAEDVLEQTKRHVEDAHRMALTAELAERLRWLIHDRTSPAHQESIQRSS
jgi:predicted small metal-binding protein